MTFLEVDTTIPCARCGVYLLRESIPKYWRGRKGESTSNWPLFNLHCMQCDHYYIENWREFNYCSFESTRRHGPSLRSVRLKTRGGFVIGDKSAPYCLIRYHKPFAIPREFHEYYERIRAEERKKVMI